MFTGLVLNFIVPDLCVDESNEYRQLHQNVKDLKWDRNLERRANKVAEQLVESWESTHDLDREIELIELDIGENVFRFKQASNFQPPQARRSTSKDHGTHFFL